MSARWCTDVVADRPNWAHTCNKQKLLKNKRVKYYNMNTGNCSELLFLYEVYCAKREVAYSEGDFTGSKRQVDKMKRYLGGESFQFCKSFIMMIKRKTAALLDNSSDRKEENTSTISSKSMSPSSSPSVCSTSPQFISEEDISVSDSSASGEETPSDRKGSDRSVSRSLSALESDSLGTTIEVYTEEDGKGAKKTGELQHGLCNITSVFMDGMSAVEVYSALSAMNT